MAVGDIFVPQLVQNCDVALTCLEYAGVAAPSGVDFDTRSLVPVLDGHPAPDDLDRTVFCATSLHWPMIRRGRYKYMAHALHPELPVLFDLESDPLERVNVVDDPANRAIRDELAERLRATLCRPIVDVPASNG